MAEFTRSSDVAPLLRRHYLASLIEPQEVFLLERARAGQVWSHQDGAYGVIHQDTLVEFSCAHSARSTQLLGALLDQRGVRSALVASFDVEAVSFLKTLGWTSSIGGFLFRTRKHEVQPMIRGVEIHAAKPGDVDALWQINEGFFDSRDEVADLAVSYKLWTVRLAGTIVGCGMCQRVVAGRDAVDIGMLVAKSMRRRGLGTCIVNSMADRLEGAGLRPICGCAASNAGSKATLEKAGFVADHQLLSFTP